jgi:hypothetical protein
MSRRGRGAYRCGWEGHLENRNGGVSEDNVALNNAGILEITTAFLNSIT